MIKKRTYIWKLATFLSTNDKTMSGGELADHLNRNDFTTEYEAEYEGGRGTYTLIRETWNWLNDELGLPGEAQHIERAFVKPDGSYAYE